MPIASEVAKLPSPSRYHRAKSQAPSSGDLQSLSMQFVPAKPSDLSRLPASTCAATRGQIPPGLHLRRHDDCAISSRRCNKPAVHARGQQPRVRPRLWLPPAIWRHLKSLPQPRCRPHYMKTDRPRFLLGKISKTFLWGSISVKPGVLCDYRFLDRLCYRTVSESRKNRFRFQTNSPPLLDSLQNLFLKRDNFRRRRCATVHDCKRVFGRNSGPTHSKSFAESRILHQPCSRDFSMLC